jgi:ubiquinone/menaquinone biosynthesis C-methylase UbiE
MDADDVDAALLDDSLAFIRRVNVALGYTRATLRHLERFSRRWLPGQRVTILDVATGSADVPVAILRWASRRGFDVRVIGVDRHAATVAAAARAAAGWGDRLALVRGDALALPVGAGGVDYAIASMFLHHLSDADATAALAAMGQVARRGVIVADLLRHRRAYAWISLLTLLSNPMVRHDARVSIRQAFTKDEVLRIRDEAGLGFAAYHRHFGHRFVLAGER